MQEPRKYSMACGRLIRLRREALGLRLEDLAAALKMKSRAAVANLEAGRQAIYLDQLWEVASVLQTSVLNLMPDPASIDGDLRSLGQTPTAAEIQLLNRMVKLTS